VALRRGKADDGGWHWSSPSRVRLKGR
jgi:hypothetical protein